MLENKAYVELYKGKSNGIVAFATVFYKGLRINNISVRKRRSGEIYLDFPFTYRKKNGEFVKDANGYTIKDYVINPLCMDVRKEIEDLVFPKVKVMLTLKMNELQNWNYEMYGVEKKRARRKKGEIE
jgi:hypothetical protein